jgi:hypothetical protein
VSLTFNEAALNNLLESPDGPLGQKLRFVSETIEANYQAVVAKIWENQSALARPGVGFHISSGDFGLQSEIGIDGFGRVADYMAAKFQREDWVVPAIMAGWDDQL